jgi:hypothetical protein
MAEITARVCIDGREVDYLDGSYQNAGNLTAATLTFKLPLTYGGMKKLWNKEVTFYMHEFDTVPMFRGWIRRTNETFNDIEIIAQDGFGYMREAGDTEVAKIALTEESNLDGLTIGAALVKALELANLDTKIKTDFIRDTTPYVSTVRLPLRGTMKIQDIMQTLLKKAIDKSGTLPRPNIARIIDDGSYNQLLIELESLIDDTATIQHVFTERENIVDLNIINRKVPTIIVVNAQNDQKGTFIHDSALSAYDRSYLEVENTDLKSGAEAKDFATKLFQANLKNQYEYTITTFEGAYLSENDVIRIETEETEFEGNYRVIGKQITFSPSGFSLSLNINRKPPTLAEYISSREN